MNYTIMPSLEHRALTKIAITLLNQDDIRALVAKPFFSSADISEGEEKCKEIEHKVIEKVLQLPLPEHFKKEISGIIKPITYEILKLKDATFYFDIYPGIDLSNKLCWTPQGTVDKKKTVEVLLNDENLDITTRYRLACIYCLEDDIPELWNKIPENDRKSFYSEEDPRDINQQKIVVFWTYIVKGEVDKLDNMVKRRRYFCSLYQYAFECAAVDFNKAGIEYFFQKLTSKERDDLLVRFAVDVAVAAYMQSDADPVADPDVLCFLLSQMDEQQQIEVFKRCGIGVLLHLLDWPWQSFFMETANRMWEFLPKDSYAHVLLSIVLRVVNGYKNCNYQQLFKEFWKQSPDANKRHVFGEYFSASTLLQNLFIIEDVENVRLILKNATVKEKEDIFFKGGGLFERLIYSDNWDSLKLFVQECISSKEAMIEFKEKKRLSLPRGALESERWKECFNLLDYLIHKDDKKRSMEKGVSSPAKRLHSAKFEEVIHSIKK